MQGSVSEAGLGKNHLQRQAAQRLRQAGEVGVEGRGAGAADLRVQLQRPQTRQVAEMRGALQWAGERTFTGMLNDTRISDNCLVNRG